MKKILLTRMQEDNEEDRYFFQSLGYEVCEVPLLEVQIKRPITPFIEAFRQADWLFFTSRYAVKFCWECLVEAGLSESLSEKKIASIGKKTSEKLEEYGVNVDFEASVPMKEFFFREWLDQKYQAKKILYPTSQLADQQAVSFFRNTAYIFTQQVIYQNQMPLGNSRLLKNCLEDPMLESVYITAPSIWHRLKKWYEQSSEAHSLMFICLGETTKRAIEADGYHAVLKREWR